MEMSNCFYHGILNSNVWKKEKCMITDESLTTLESILRNRFILSRSSLKEQGIIIDKKPNWNKEAFVSICHHPSNTNIEQVLVNFRRNHEEAFKLFILNNISIIFNKNVLKLYNPNDSFYNLKMSDEIQIKTNIPLDDVVAIGIPDETKRFQTRCEALFDIINYFSSQNWDVLLNDLEKELDTNYSEQCLEKNIIMVEKVKSLLKKYGFSVDIVEPLNGYPYPSYEIQNNSINELKKRMKYIKSK